MWCLVLGTARSILYADDLRRGFLIKVLDDLEIPAPYPYFVIQPGEAKRLVAEVFSAILVVQARQFRLSRSGPAVVASAGTREVYSKSSPKIRFFFPPATSKYSARHALPRKASMA